MPRRRRRYCIIVDPLGRDLSAVAPGSGLAAMEMARGSLPPRQTDDGRRESVILLFLREPTARNPFPRRGADRSARSSDAFTAVSDFSRFLSRTKFYASFVLHRFAEIQQLRFDRASMQPASRHTFPVKNNPSQRVQHNTL